MNNVSALNLPILVGLARISGFHLERVFVGCYKTLSHRNHFLGVQYQNVSTVPQELCNTEEPCEEFTSRHSLEWKFLSLDHR